MSRYESFEKRYDKVTGVRHYHKNILKLENLIASLIYCIVNGLLVFLQSLLGSLSRSSNIKTVLLFHTGNLGDIVCAIPAFRILRKHFSSAQLILLTDSGLIFNNTQPLTSLISNDIFDEIIYYKPEDLRSPRKIYSLLNCIKKHKIDIMIYFGLYDATFTRLLRDMLFFYLGGCRKLYGFRLNRHRIFRTAQRYYRVFDSETERLLKLLLPLDISHQEVDFTLPITEKDKQFIDNMWSNSDNIKGRIVVAINPGAKFSVNHWPKENFLQLSRKLIDKYNFFIILIGRENTQDTCSFIESGLQGKCLNLCGKTNFMQTAEILLRSKLLISCDSGPLHLAAAVKTPVVGIYSARDYPNCWYPWGRQHIIIRHDVNCQACLKTECATMKCIKGIDVDEILFACKEILDRQTAQGVNR